MKLGKNLGKPISPPVSKYVSLLTTVPWLNMNWSETASVNSFGRMSELRVAPLVLEY
jgi:hypothetical protein